MVDFHLEFFPLGHRSFSVAILAGVLLPFQRRRTFPGTEPELAKGLAYSGFGGVIEFLAHFLYLSPLHPSAAIGNPFAHAGSFTMVSRKI